MNTAYTILVYFASTNILFIDKCKNAAALITILEIGVLIVAVVLVVINRFFKFKLITELISKSTDIVEVCIILCIAMIGIVLLLSNIGG